MCMRKVGQLSRPALANEPSSMFPDSTAMGFGRRWNSKAKGMPPSRIRPSRRGGFDLRLPEQERAILGSLPGQLLAALQAARDDPTSMSAPLSRLFPPAHLKDEDAEAA